MTPNTLPSENVALLATIGPDAISQGESDSAVVDMSRFHALLVTLAVGSLGTADRASVRLQSSTTEDGVFADIAGKSCDWLDAENTQALINLAADELTVGHRYVKAVLSIDGDADDENSISEGEGLVDAAVILQGFFPRYAPASQFNNDDVVEVVN
jgi:hypothetical protein